MTSSTQSPVAYPLDLRLDADVRVARWRPLLHWLLVIPQSIVAVVLFYAMNVVTFLAFFAILFTGRYPRGMFNFSAMTLRYSWRVGSYSNFMRETYPPFDFTASSADPANDPARLDITYPERLSRWKPFIKWLLAIPHFVVLYALGIAAWLCTIVAFFAVLFTGRYPAGLRNFVVGVNRWMLRLYAYLLLMTDAYPPFSLSE